MPEQEIFYEQAIGEKRVVVIKSYDKTYAREAFDQVGPKALLFLKESLQSQDKLIPENDEAAEALWEELEEDSREDWNKFSYFVVKDESKGTSTPVYVSADWPSAEAFAKQYCLG